MQLPKICAQCGARIDDGIIFCRKCGATLRPPTPLIQSSDDDFKVRIMSPFQRLVATLVRAIAMVAAGVAFLCPLSTGTEVLVFISSCVIALSCHLLLTRFDDSYIDEHINNGYWPEKPIDWNSHADSLVDAKDGQEK